MSALNIPFTGPERLGELLVGQVAVAVGAAQRSPRWNDCEALPASEKAKRKCCSKGDKKKGMTGPAEGI